MIITDKATAFTGRSFREFCKKHKNKLVLSFIYTLLRLRHPVERGHRTLKEILSTEIKAGDRLTKTLEGSLNVMKKPQKQGSEN